MLGMRDPPQYGTIPRGEIDGHLRALGAELGADITRCQTHHEGAMGERIHQAYRVEIDAVVIDAGTHRSYGIRDALAMLTVRVVEIPMSDIPAGDAQASFGVCRDREGADLQIRTRQSTAGLRAAVSARAATRNRT